MKLIKGNFYRFEDPNFGMVVGEYYGRQKGFECQICRFGHNAHCFNIYHTKGNWYEYETFSYGKEHLPEILEDLGKPADPIMAWPEEAKA